MEAETDALILGCTYPSACEYDEDANFNDGSCIFMDVRRTFQQQGGTIIQFDQIHVPRRGFDRGEMKSID